MMGTDFQFRDKIPIAILGATGLVGQKFIELLFHHLWFEVAILADVEPFEGKLYRDAVPWLMDTPLPLEIGNQVIRKCKPDFSCSLVFSALDSSVADEIESKFSQAGFIVISNTSNHYMDQDVPLIVPEYNSDLLNLDKSTIVSKDMIPGDVGKAIFNAELLVKMGRIYW